MIKYKYNGVLLPEIPDTGDYIFSCITNMMGMYLLIVANPTGGFVHGSDGSISLAASSTGKMYRALEYEWELYDTDDSTSVDGFYLMRPGTVEAVWTNTDIPTSTGGVYLAASTAVPVQCCHHPSFIAGLAAGLASVGTLRMLSGQGEPTAYLYNGVQLPPLPEVEGYEYRFMTIAVTSSSTSAYLYCSNVPIYKNDVASLFASVISKADGEAICYPCTVLPDGTVTEDWHRYENGDKTFTADAKFAVTNTGSIKWANYDMLNYSDDSVYLAASEPVPVYGGDS